jgi:hypothetical protein
MQKTLKTRRVLLWAARGLPKATSLSNLAERLRPSQLQNYILLVSPLRPLHLLLPLLPQAPRTGLACGQPLVVRLLKMQTVIIDAVLLIYILSHFRQFPHMSSSMCSPKSYYLPSCIRTSIPLHAARLGWAAS